MKKWTRLFTVGLLSLALIGSLNVSARDNDNEEDNKQEEVQETEAIIAKEVQEILVNDKVEDFKWEQRMLWFDHGVWTRNAIVADIGNQPDAEIVLNRLLRNQEDIGNAFRLWYGNIPADELTRLLKEHVMLTTQILHAEKNQNVEALRQNKDRWYKNAENIALFLSDLSYQMEYVELRRLFDNHLEMIQEITDSRLNQDLEAEINRYDENMRQMTELSDYIAGAIVRQFPEEFK